MIHCLPEGTMTTSGFFLSTTKLCVSVSVCNHHSCSKTLISRTTQGLAADGSGIRALKAISIANEDTTPTASLCTLDPPFRRRSHSSCLFRLFRSWPTISLLPSSVSDMRLIWKCYLADQMHGGRFRKTEFRCHFGGGWRRVRWGIGHNLPPRKSSSMRKQINTFTEVNKVICASRTCCCSWKTVLSTKYGAWQWLVNIKYMLLHVVSHALNHIVHIASAHV